MLAIIVLTCPTEQNGRLALSGHLWGKVTTEAENFELRFTLKKNINNKTASIKRTLISNISYIVLLVWGRKVTTDLLKQK